MLQHNTRTTSFVGRWQCEHLLEKGYLFNKNDMTEKKSHGGARKGASRPRIFKEPTTINFKCELSDKIAAKEKYKKSLNQMFIKWLKSII